MKRINILLSFALISLTLLYACSGSRVACNLPIEKRHYRPGWHIHIAGKGKANEMADQQVTRGDAPLNATHDKMGPLIFAAEKPTSACSHVAGAPVPLPQSNGLLLRSGKTVHKHDRPEIIQIVPKLAGMVWQATIEKWTVPQKPGHTEKALDDEDEISTYELCLYSGLLALLFVFLTRSTAWDTALTGWVLSPIFIILSVGAGLWGFVKLFDKGTLMNFLYILGGLALSLIALLVLYWFLWFA